MKEKKYICSIKGCGKKFIAQNKLKYHTNSHFEWRVFKCNYENCDKSYTNPAHLKRHKRAAHIRISEQVECQVCQVMISNKSNLRRHVFRIHIKEQKKLSCDQPNCTEFFFRKSDLVSHLMQKHEAIARCQFCDKEFHKDLIKKHEKSHKKFTCEYCSEKFFVNAKYRKHKKTCESKKFKCDVCKKEFVFKCRLQDHLQTHEDLRNVFECKVDGCTKFYFHKKNLKQHQQISHKNRLYDCPECFKSFTANKNLKNHMRVHKNGQLLCVEVLLREDEDDDKIRDIENDETNKEKPINEFQINSLTSENEIKKIKKKRKDANMCQRSSAVKLAQLEGIVPLTTERDIVKNYSLDDQILNDILMKID